MAITVEALLATAELDVSGFTRGLDTLTQGLERYDRQTSALTARPAVVTLDANIAPFTAGLTAGEAVLNGFRAKVAAPLPLALARTGDLTRDLVALEQGTAQAVAEAVRLMTLPVDQLQARLKALGVTPVGLDLRQFLSQIAQGQASVQQFTAAIRQGAVEELNRLGASAAQTAAVLRGFDQVSTVTLDTTPAVAAAESLIAKLGLTTRGVETTRQALAAPLTIAGGDTRALDLLPVQLQQIDQRAPEVRQSLDRIAAGMARAGSGALVFEAGLRTLQAQQATAAAAAQQLATVNERLVIGMSQAGRAAEVATAGTRAWERGMATLRAQQDALTAGTTVAGRSTRDLSRSLGTLAIASVGAQGPVSRVALSFLPFLGVSLPVVAAGAAIAVMYDRLTAGARKAAEATDSFIKAQADAAQARNPFEQMLRQIQGAPGEIQGVTNRLRGLRTELVLLQQQQAASVIGDFGFAGFNARIAKAQTDIRNAETALVESARGFAERVFAEIDRATQGQLAAQQAAIQDSLTLEQQGFRLRDVQLRSAFEQEQTTRQQFTGRRIALAREAAAAEVAAIQRQQESIFLGPAPRTDEDRAAQRSRLEALDRALDLRRGELALQLQAIQNEQALAAATELRTRLLEQQQLRIQQAGGGNLVPGSQGRGLIPTTDVDFRPEPIEIPLILRPALQREQFGTGLGDEIQAEFDRARQAADFLAVALGDVDLTLALIGNANITGPRAQAKQLADAILDLNQGLDSIVGAAVNVGLIGEEAANAIGSVLDLGDAIGGLRNSLGQITTGGVLGLVGAGLNVVGGLFGQSETSREHERIQQQNTEALERLRDEVSGLTTSLGALDRAERATGAITPTDIGVARTIGFFDPQQGIDFINLKLEGFGVTIEELDRQAEALGLDVIDEQGRLVAGAFEALNEVLGITIDKLTTFDETSFSEQRLVEEWRSRFAGTEQTPDEVFRQTIEALGNIPTSIDERFAGVDLANEEAVRALFQKLIDDFAAGRISAEELGELTKQGLFDLFRQGADYLDSFNEATQEATERLGALNVPSVIRVDALRAAASRPEWVQVDQPLVNATRPDLRGLDQRAVEAFGLREESASLKTSADRLGDLPGAEASRDFLEKIATETPEDLLAALEQLTATEGAGLRNLADRLAGLAPDQEGAGLDTLADRLSGLAPGQDNLADFLERIASRTPDDLLAALDELTATVADRALPEGAVSLVRESRETVEIRTETDRARAGVQITYTGPVIFNITAQPGQSPSDMAEAIREELRRHSMADTGDMAKAGDYL